MKQIVMAMIVTGLLVARAQAEGFKIGVQGGGTVGLPDGGKQISFGAQAGYDLNKYLSIESSLVHSRETRNVGTFYTQPFPIINATLGEVVKIDITSITLDLRAGYPFECGLKPYVGGGLGFYKYHTRVTEFETRGKYSGTFVSFDYSGQITGDIKMKDEVAPHVLAGLAMELGESVEFFAQWRCAFLKGEVEETTLRYEGNRTTGRSTDASILNIITDPFKQHLFTLGASLKF